MPEPTVVTRFAPSPTGLLHIGNVRTALFAWLFARQHKGKFILRIEDTDRQRFVQEALDDILDMLAWLGLDYDEGPIFQSQRLALYQQHAQRLLETGWAYRCFCPKERLDQLHAAQEAARGDTGYDRRCRDLPPEVVRQNLAAGQPSVIRFRVPLPGRTVATDLLRGRIEVDNRTLDDFVLLKSDGFPTYHLAHVVDDHDMHVTHVIRGEEWISSLPRHQLLHEAFGWTPPTYVHMTVLLDPSGGKMSKRKMLQHNLPFAMRDFRARGFLVDALINFMALLGWGPSDNQEIKSREELLRDFRLEDLSTGSPVFSFDKLNRINGLYIRRLSPSAFVEAIIPFLQKAGLVSDPVQPHQRDLLARLAPLVQERVHLLADAPAVCRLFFVSELDYGDGAALVPKKTAPAQALQVLREARTLIADQPELDRSRTEAALRSLAQRLGLSAGQVFMALRVAVTGSTVSPPLIETMEVLGRPAVLNRLDRAIAVLQARLQATT